MAKIHYDYSPKYNHNNLLRKKTPKTRVQIPPTKIDKIHKMSK